jgi:DNA-binding transcriptional LysR family regulator
MELRQLEYFVAVAEEGSFTRAAVREHVAQPGISAQIKQLEREFGEPLFERIRTGARLTEAGRAALGPARSALAAVATARANVDELAGLTRGRVAIGTIAAGGAMDLPELLASYHRRYPEVEITLVEDTSDVLVDRVHSGELDLAWVGRSGTTRTPGVQTRKVVDERVTAVVARDHPLAGRRSIRLSQLTDHPLICQPRGTGIRGALDAGGVQAGVHVAVQFETTAPLVSIDLARKGLGVAVVPESAAAFAHEGVHPLAISAPRMRSRLELAWRVDASGAVAGGPATRALVAHARTLVGRSAQGEVGAPLA